MFVLDTDHVTEYQRGASAAAQRLKQQPLKTDRGTAAESSE